MKRVNPAFGKIFFYGFGAVVCTRNILTSIAGTIKFPPSSFVCFKKNTTPTKNRNIFYTSSDRSESTRKILDLLLVLSTFWLFFFVWGLLSQARLSHYRLVDRAAVPFSRIVETATPN
jgi:hypothetical protein